MLMRPPLVLRFPLLSPSSLPFRDGHDGLPCLSRAANCLTVGSIVRDGFQSILFFAIATTTTHNFSVFFFLSSLRQQIICIACWLVSCVCLPVRHRNRTVPRLAENFVEEQQPIASVPSLACCVVVECVCRVPVPVLLQRTEKIGRKLLIVTVRRRVPLAIVPRSKVAPLAPHSRANESDIVHAEIRWLLPR